MSGGPRYIDPKTGETRRFRVGDLTTIEAAPVSVDGRTVTRPDGTSFTPRLSLQDARLELAELADKLPGVQDPLVTSVALARLMARLPAYLTRVSPDNRAQWPRARSLVLLAMENKGGLGEVVFHLNVRPDEFELIAPVNAAAREEFDQALRDCTAARAVLAAG